MENDRQLQVLIKQEKFNLSQRLSNISQRHSTTTASTSTSPPSASSSVNANKKSLLEKLRIWQIQYNIPQDCFDDLLDILKSENVNTSHSDCEEFKNEMRTTIAEMKDLIKEQNGEILNIMAENFVYLRQLQHRDTTRSSVHDAQYIFRFPISNEAELKKLEVEIADNESEMVDTFKKMLHPGGIKKNFDKILSDEIISSYNYSGVKGKTSFRLLSNINSALYKACFTNGYSKKDYIMDVKHAFRLLKNRKNKAEFVKRKAARKVKQEMSFI